jgi:hypothetical protein
MSPAFGSRSSKRGLNKFGGSSKLLRQYRKLRPHIHIFFKMNIAFDNTNFEGAFNQSVNAPTDWSWPKDDLHTPFEPSC